MARARAGLKAWQAAAASRSRNPLLSPNGATRIRAVTLVLTLAAGAALFALAAAVASAFAFREASAERALLRQRLAELAERVEGAERAAGHAQAQAEVTSQLLLEKGLADEDDIEAVRQLVVDAAPGEHPPGGETLH
jgi:hypothetical protein